MRDLKEAKFYSRIDSRHVKCVLCPHNCTINDGASGICGARKNDGGVLYSIIYGMVTAVAMDPIEKKPLYHFYPGSRILSIGTKGCNLKCPYCQNWHISQDMSAVAEFYEPGDVVDLAVRNNSIGVAYTYSEPMIWFEYVMDTAGLCREKGLRNVMVTNGYVNSEPLGELLGLVDAMNVDLKSFREETYRKINRGGLREVCETIRMSRERGCHVEVTTLIVTGINDDMDEMKDIIDFLSSIDKNIPWHISRYFPNYKYHEAETDVEFMKRIYAEGRKKLNHVYCGNVAIHEGSDTSCPSCGNLLVKRSGYNTKIAGLKSGMCSRCGAGTGIKI